MTVAYWPQRLAGELGVQELLPGDHPHAAHRSIAVPRARAADFVAAVQLVLRRYTGVTDVLLGLPVTVDGGVHVVVHRSDLSEDVPVGQFLDAVAAELDAALAHRDVPYERVVREIGRDAFQVALALDELVDLDTVTDYGQVDIRVAGDRLTVRCADVRMAGFLCADLRTVLGELEPGRMTSTVLERSVLEHPVVQLPADDLEHSIPERFVRQAIAAPQSIAVRADDGVLTYGELHRTAAGIAAAIPGSGGNVGIMLGHGVRTPAAILGVLLSGNAYVPLDPSYPAERLAYMVRHARIGLVLVEPDSAPLADELTTVPKLDVTTVDVASTVDDAVGPCTADSVAYVLYTSGSTGQPKGVQQNHRNVQFQVRNHVTSHEITAADRVSVLSSFSFDMSITDLFTALLTGATAVLVDVRTHGLAHLARRLVEDRVTIYHSTPTVYRYLLGSLAEHGRLPDIRLILLGGEELTARDVRLFHDHFAAHCVFVNGYGATEISFACQNHITMDQPVPGSVLPVGHPLAGLEVLLLAPDGRPAALRGEIVVRSPHVSVGYWDNPAADAEKFLDWQGVRAYRTGDIGRRLADGRIVFAGRRDRQVKVRGYRVELGEIEAALADHPAVGQVAVVARTQADGTREIVAYVASAREQHIDPAVLRKQAGTRLPHFMVPRAVVVLDDLPLTPTGKIDVRALPEPTRSAPMDDATSTPMEQIVAEIWCAVLEVDSVGRQENFFDAGGHSLLLASVAQRLEVRLGCRIPLHRMFQYPTIAGLAAHLTGLSTEDSPVADGLSRVADRMARRRRARRAGER